MKFLVSKIDFFVTLVLHNGMWYTCQNKLARIIMLPSNLTRPQTAEVVLEKNLLHQKTEEKANTKVS